MSCTTHQRCKSGFRISLRFSRSPISYLPTPIKRDSTISDYSTIFALLAVDPYRGITYHYSFKNQLRATIVNSITKYPIEINHQYKRQFLKLRYLGYYTKAAFKSGKSQRELQTAEILCLYYNKTPIVYFYISVNSLILLKLYRDSDFNSVTRLNQN